MRTTAAKWNEAMLYGSFAEHHFSDRKKDVKSCPMPPSARPGERYDYRQLFGFDRDAPRSCFGSDV